MEHIALGDFSLSPETMELTTIPRASTISATDADIGSFNTIKINQSYGGFTHSIRYSFGRLSGYITANGGTSTTEVKFSDTTVLFQIPTSFYEIIPNSPYGYCGLEIRTYSGYTQIGDVQTTSFTAYVNRYASSPIVSGSTVVDVNDTVTSITRNNTILVRYMSTARVTPSVTPRNSASIKNITVEGYQVSGNYIDIPKIEKNTITVYAIDTREYDGSEILSSTNNKFTWVEYIIPTFANTEFKRLSATSDIVKVKYSGYYYNGNIGNSSNTLSLKWQARRKGAWTWEDYDLIASGNLSPTLGPNTGRNTFEGEMNLTGRYSYQEAFEFRIIATDLLNSIPYQVTVSEGTPYYDFGKDRNGNNYFNINGNIYQNNQSLIQMACNINSNNVMLIPSESYIPFEEVVFNNTNGKVVFNNNGTITINYDGYVKVSFNIWFWGYANTRPWLKFKSYTKNITYIDVIDDITSNFVSLTSANRIIPVENGEQFALYFTSATGEPLTLNDGSGTKASYCTIELI